MFESSSSILRQALDFIQGFVPPSLINEAHLLGVSIWISLLFWGKVLLLLLLLVALLYLALSLIVGG